MTVEVCFQTFQGAAALIEFLEALLVLESVHALPEACAFMRQQGASSQSAAETAHAPTRLRD